MSKPPAAGKFSNSPTYVKFDMREVPRNVGEWLLVVLGCAGADVGGTYYEDPFYFTYEGDTKTRD